MNTPVKLITAFLLALSQMFSFVPRERKAVELEPYHPTMRQSFTAVWGYFSKAVNNGQRQ